MKRPFHVIAYRLALTALLGMAMGCTTGNETPVAKISASATSADVGSEIVFDSSQSSDEEGSISSCLWNFGDGVTSSERSVGHAFAAEGTYSVTLTVFDAENLSDAETVSITITKAAEPTPPENTAPTAVFTASATSAMIGQDIAFNGTASADSDGTIASYAWNFGDGATATDSKVTHAYTTAGTYTIQLTVTDDDGKTATTTLSVTIAEAPVIATPTAAFTTTPNAPIAGASVSFDGSSSASAKAGGTIASYAWDFGDGATATGSKATHAYATAGTYTVRLNVTDDEGKTAQCAKSLTIAKNAAPTASISLAAASAATGETIAFDASASSDVDGSVVSYAWDFGDGATATGKTASHAFTVAGKFAVTLSVVDDLGATGSTYAIVTVTGTASGTGGNVTVTVK